MGFGSRGGFPTPAAERYVPNPTRVFVAVEGVAKSPSVDTPTKVVIAVDGIANSPSIDTPTFTLTTT